jgi:hypothetical protein
MLQAIKVLIRQACMLRGDAQMAVQSEIRSILDSISEDTCNICVNDEVETKGGNMDKLGSSERECDDDSQPGFNFDELFAPLCRKCGWIEATCCCRRLSKQSAEAPSQAKLCSEDSMVISHGPTSETSSPSTTLKSRRGIKRSRPGTDEATAAVQAATLGQSLTPTRRSTRRRCPTASE